MSLPASLYLRLSREAGEAQTGLRSQEADLRALAAEHSLTVAAVHVDDGLSGDKRNRAAYRAWLADGRAGHVLLAYHLDRVSRGGLAGIAEFLDVIDGRDGDRRTTGTRFLSFSDRLDSDSPDWVIRVSVMAGLAQAERQRIAERARRAHKQRKAEGRYSGGVPPYGLRVAPNPAGAGKVLEPDPEEAAFVREAARRVLSGESLGRVARWLTAHGAQPRRAAAWSRVTVRQMLTGPAAALLTDAERAMLTDVLRPRGSRPFPAATGWGSRMLTGVLVCAGCGTPLRVSQTVGRVTYRCASPAAATGQRLCGSPVSCWAEPVEALVSSRFLASDWAGLPETVTVRLADETAAERVAVAERVRELQASAMAARGAERAALLGELEAAEGRADALAAAPVTRLAVLRETGRTLGEAWEAGSAEDRRELLAGTVGRLTLAPARDRVAARRSGGFDPERLLGWFEPVPGDER